ncbi:Sperm-associated antigen 17 [Chytriomyces hyalinus]|nr:Sperm-associated antigen 17 [Chytriomyces hyalinus]
MSKQPQSSQGAKATPQAVPSAASGLNDDSWSAYIYTVFPDDKLGVSAVQPLYESILSGYRSKFTLFQKSDLMQWYSDNVKLDVCKEVKAAMDANGGNDAEVPDLLMARMIKHRLMILKQEGIDARNAARILAETPTTPVTLAPIEPQKAGAKLPTKDDKKDRAKSPAKKGAAKGSDKKGPEALSRPESAQASDISKRKNKLREKGAKSESKIQSIGDEPADGPDVYYLFKDFTNMGVLNSLMEDCDVPIHSVFRLSEATTPISATDPTPSLISLPTTPSDFASTSPGAQPTTAINNIPNPINISALDSASVLDMSGINRLLAESREWLASAPENCHWRGTAWLHIQIPMNSLNSSSPPLPAAVGTTTTGQAAGSLPNINGKDLFDAIALRIYSQLRLRRDFKSFYQSENVVTVPGLEDAQTLKMQLKSLANCLDVMPAAVFEGQVSAEVILGAVLEQSVRAVKAEEEMDGSAGMEPGNFALVDEMGSLVGFFEKAFKKLSLGASAITKHGDGQDDAKIKACRVGDSLTFTKYLLGDLSPHGLNSNELTSTLLEAYPMLHFQTATRNRADSPAQNPSTAFSRLANMAELRKSSASNFSDTLRSLFQRQAEELLNNEVPECGWDLNAWCWTETLDRATMAQVLQQAKVSHPSVKSTVCSQTGKLIIVMSGNGAVGAKRYDGTLQLHVKTKLDFGAHHEIMERCKQYVVLPPKVKNELRPPVYASGDAVVQKNDSFTVLYALDGGKITVHREQHLNFKPEIRTHLLHNENSITWSNATQSKLGPYLTAVFENHMVFTVTERDGALNAVLSCPDGLIVEFRSNGNIVQRLDSSGLTAASQGRNLSAKEVNRVITTNGSVIRYLTNSFIEVLQPDGTTSVSTKDGWITTSNTGARVVTTSINGGDSNSEQLAPIQFARETIIALSETIITRQDMVVTTMKKDGSVVAEHADGTVISTVMGGDEVAPAVTVETLGMAKVTMKDAGRHAVLRFTDGSVLEKSVLEDGCVSYRIQNDARLFHFETALNGSSTFTPILANSHGTDPSSTTEYKFNWIQGTLDATDSDGTKFTINRDAVCSIAEASRPSTTTTTTTTTTTPSVQAEGATASLVPAHGFVKSLAGLSPALLRGSRGPRNPPRVFVVGDDGAGVQFLRDVDLIHYFKRQLLNPDAEILEEVLADGSGLSVNVVGKEHSSDKEHSDGAEITFFRQLVRTFHGSS